MSDIVEYKGKFYKKVPSGKSEEPNGFDICGTTENPCKCAFFHAEAACYENCKTCIAEHIFYEETQNV